MALGRKKWTVERIAMLGTAPDAHLAMGWGLAEKTVASARIRRGIPAFQTQVQRRWTQQEMALLRIMSDTQVSNLLGRTLGSVRAARRELGIQKRGTLPQPHLEDIRSAYTLTAMPVHEIASKFDVKPQFIHKRVRERGWKRPDYSEPSL